MRGLEQVLYGDPLPQAVVQPLLPHGQLTAEVDLNLWTQTAKHLAMGLQYIIPVHVHVSRVFVFGLSPTLSFFFGKVTALGILCYFALILVCLSLLASFFHPSSSLINMYIHVHVYTFVHNQ